MWGRIRSAVVAAVRSVTRAILPESLPVDDTPEPPAPEPPSTVAKRITIADTLPALDPDTVDDEPSEETRWHTFKFLEDELDIDMAALNHWNRKQDVYELVQLLVGLHEKIAESPDELSEDVLAGMPDEVRVAMFELASDLNSLDGPCFITARFMRDEHSPKPNTPIARDEATHVSDGGLRQFLRWALWQVTTYRAHIYEVDALPGQPKRRARGKSAAPKAARKRGRPRIYRKESTRAEAKREQMRAASARYRERLKAAARAAARKAKAKAKAAKARAKERAKAKAKKPTKKGRKKR